MKLSQLKQLSGKRFKRTAVGMSTIEDIPSLKKELQRQADNQELTMVDEGDCWSFGDNRYCTKPKIQKVVYGIVEFRSKDYTFLADGKSEKSYGTTLKAENVIDNGFVSHVDNDWYFEYTLT